MDEKIVSLCMIVNKDNGSGRSYFRLADLKDDRLLPYIHSSNGAPGTVTEVLSFARDTGELPTYTISLYEWTPYEDYNGKWHSHVNPFGKQWIEVVYSNHKTIDQIVRQLRDGWIFHVTYEQTHNLLIACETKDDIATCIYVPCASLEFKHDRYALSAEIETLDIYRIEKQSVKDCKCRNSPSDPRHYLQQLHCGNSIQKVLVKPEVTILRIIKERINKMTFLHRQDKKAIHSVLEKISQQTIAEKIADKLKLPADQAQKIVFDFIASTQERICDETCTDRILDFLVLHDSSLVEQLRQKIEAEWETEHTKSIAAAQKERSAAQARLQTLEAQIALNEDRLSCLQAQTVQCEESVANANQLYGEIQKRILERLQQIRDHKGEALADEAFSLSSLSFQAVSPQPAIPFTLDYRPATDAEIHTPTQPRDVVDSLQVTLKDCVVNDAEKSRSLALFLTSAVACRQPLILAGPQAAKITDAVSSATTGRPCIRFRLHDASGYTAMREAISQHPVAALCVEDAFASALYDTYCALSDAFPERPFFYIVRHKESLCMEPASLFTDLFPVLTDYFVDNDELPEPNYMNALSILSNNPPLKKECARIQAGQHKWFADNYFSPLLQTRCARLQGWMEHLDGKAAKRAIWETLFVPLMICLRQSDTIRQILESSYDLPQETQIELLRFAEVQP